MSLKKKGLKFQIAIKLQVTRKYRVKGRIHASPERKEKNNVLFKVGAGKKTEARRLNLIKFVHLWWLPRVNWRCAAS